VLFGPFGPLFGVSFFCVLTLMGISASLAILEAFSLALEPYFPRLSRPRLFLLLTSIAFVLGSVYFSFDTMGRIFFIDRVLSLMSLLLVGIMSGLVFLRHEVRGRCTRILLGLLVLFLFVVWSVGLYTFFTHAGGMSFLQHLGVFLFLPLLAFGMTFLTVHKKRK
jgi:SNF family Na+-dependent transporter